ncbi:MAG: response regulator [Cyanobacteria bacterium J06650_10]
MNPNMAMNTDSGADVRAKVTTNKVTDNNTSSSILIVDDIPSNIQVLFDFLSGSGYRVAVAKSGESALRRLQASRPDLILLDVMMPGIDGFETCRQIKARADTRDIPIIFMTALSESVNKVKGLSLGAVDYITKPIEQEEVLARMRVHLQLAHLNKSLEKQVADRTIHLQNTLNTLKQTQVQLVQREKMSALGELMAGVAHEINNPVNFIHGNLKPAKAYVTDLLDLIGLFQKEFPDLTPALTEHIEEIDLDFIQEDVINLLSSMKIGTERIRKIVLSLRNFSRLDDTEMSPVDIHAGIDDTLLILQGRFKSIGGSSAIKLIKAYGALPEIQCYASQLNQAFMNIISNAIDALEEAALQDRTICPQIRIKTEKIDHNRVCIRIVDNGIGIPNGHQKSLFDAFFTTKPVGKGTGLGLAISHQIVVEKHNGSLSCRSSDKGTEFRIELPIVSLS